jgi:hypothetical protein
MPTRADMAGATGKANATQVEGGLDKTVAFHFVVYSASGICRLKRVSLLVF